MVCRLKGAKFQVRVYCCCCCWFGFFLPGLSWMCRAGDFNWSCVCVCDDWSTQFILSAFLTFLFVCSGCTYAGVHVCLNVHTYFLSDSFSFIDWKAMPTLGKCEKQKQKKSQMCSEKCRYIGTGVAWPTHIRAIDREDFSAPVVATIKFDLILFPFRYRPLQFPFVFGHFPFFRLP